MAIQAIQIDIEHSWAEKFDAKELKTYVQFSSDGLKLSGQAAQISLAAPLNQLRNVTFECEKAAWLTDAFRCHSGTLQFSQPELGQQRIQFKIDANTEDEQYDIQLQNLRLDGGTVNLDISLDQLHWDTDIDAQNIPLSALQKWLPQFLDKQYVNAVNDWQPQGQISLQARIDGNKQGIVSATAKWQFTDLGFSNTTASQVAENVTTQGEISLHNTDNTWDFIASSSLMAGQVYSDPVFVDLSTSAIELSVDGKYEADSNHWTLADIKLNQSEQFNVEAIAEVIDNVPSKVEANVTVKTLSSFYSTWVKPFMVGTAAADLQLSGQVSSSISWSDMQHQLKATLNNVSVVDSQQRYNAENMNGELVWTNSEAPLDGYLSWQQAKLYSIDIGAGQLHTQTVKNGFKLVKETSIPVLDGELQINQLSLQQQEDKQITWSFDGLLLPISMESLTQALGWPIMHGKLSGVIPHVRYQSHKLTIDGALQVKVFDGTTVIRDLRLTDPLGVLPQLYANIDMKDLDLALITKTFDVGKITGRVSGEIYNLRLSNWQPVQFDAKLATSEDNPGKRIISQRAVDNLTQVGGGASGMISRSFLRFFDDFSYKRLGLSCHLRNDVCEMAGIEDTDQGYYIVKGGGGLPPWIDVIGYTRRVDWADLLERIKAVQNSSGPIIE
ncbi:hypothetical protein [Methylophaga sulfidovorans]|uniref:hypothetical protein n=1 Tax=Methylophaga sulfidovorans TaxID=45496 RepID=UPI0011608C86|nr:hypothetical protein [Methylophaga sulfidovorans]